MILAAPVVSSWLPFYYTSSMAVGVFLVVLIIIFQVKLLSKSPKVYIFELSCQEVDFFSELLCRL